MEQIDSAREIIVLLNGSRQMAQFTLPAGTYKVVADGDRVAPEGIASLTIEEDEGVSVAPIEALILLAE